MSPSTEMFRPMSSMPKVNLARVGTAFDVDTLGEVKAQLTPLLTRQGHVVLDLRGARLDSSGLGAVLSLQRKLHLQGRGLFVVTECAEFRRLLETVEATHALTLYSDLEHALNLAESTGKLGYSA